MPPKFFLYLYLSGIFTNCCYAQEYTYQHYDTKDGLAGSTVYGICQDKDGYIWFGTETGLSRFDGKHFRNFSKADGLPTNEIFGLFPDSRNRLWVISFTNEIAYIYEGKIHNQRNDPLLNRLKFPSNIRGFAETKEGNLLFYVPIKHYYVITARQGIYDIKETQTDPGKWNGEKFDLAHCNGIFYVPAIKLPEKFPAITGETTFRKVGIEPNNQYAGTIANDVSGIHIMLEGGEYHYYKTNNALSAAIINDSMMVYIGSRTGGVKLVNFITNRVYAHYLPHLYLNAVFRDREGNIWASSRNEGVYVIRPANFQSYSLFLQKRKCPVSSIWRQRGNIILAGSMGTFWSLFKSLNKHVGFAYNKPGLLKKKDIDFIPERVFLPFNTTVWSDLVANAKPDVSGQVIKSIYRLEDTLWIASNVNTAFYKISDLSNQHIVYEGRSTCAIKTGQSLYIGSLNGLYEIKPGKRQTFLGNKFTSLRGRINCFGVQDNGTLWVGTYDNGLVGYRDGKILVNITETKGGLSSNICRCIYVQGNTIWCGTEKGINKIEYTNGQYRATRKFGTADGLPTNVINALYIDSSRVYVGTSSGLVYFDENKIPLHTFSNIKMTSVTVSGRQLRPERKHYSFSPEDNNIRFEFSGITSLSGAEMNFRYRLLGADDQWKYTNDGFLNFIFLPAGKYTLQIVAVSRFGDESHMLETTFDIAPPFYNTAWFRLVIIALISMIIWWFVRSRIQKIKRSEALRRVHNQKITELEQMALRAQMNPHFIFNCMNSIQRFILRNDIVGANVYLSSFADLIRQTLEHAPKIHILLHEEISYLTNYIELEQLQANHPFSYKVIVDPKLKEKTVYIPNMVLQPYVENAIKHGLANLTNKGFLKISFQCKDDNFLECNIEDNGPGINYTLHKKTNGNNKHHSKGIFITHKRIELLNQLIADGKKILVKTDDDSSPEQPGTGTHIHILFPL